MVRHNIRNSTFQDLTQTEAKFSLGMNSEEGHVKRPMNCFMVWSREKRYHILKEHPGINNAEVSKALGAAWRKLSEEDKEPYIEEARRLTEQHKIENPGYKYQPKRRKIKRRRKPDKKIVPHTSLNKKSEARRSSGEKIHLPFKIISGPSMSPIDELGGRPSVFFPPQFGLPVFPSAFHTGMHRLCSCHCFYPTPLPYNPSWPGGTNKHFYNLSSNSCFSHHSVHEQPHTGCQVEPSLYSYKM